MVNPELVSFRAWVFAAVLLVGACAACGGRALTQTGSEGHAGHDAGSEGHAGHDAGGDGPDVADRPGPFTVGRRVPS